jgi:hypothetical protein
MNIFVGFSMSINRKRQIDDNNGTKNKIVGAYWANWIPDHDFLD